MGSKDGYHWDNAKSELLKRVRKYSLEEIVDRVFPPCNLLWETYREEIQKQELLRKNLEYLLHNGLQSQQDDVRKKVIQDFHDALFQNRESHSP